MSELVLSLFPGIGLLDMAFEEQGFSVVRGPDVLWGGDVKCFHAPRACFDGVIGGPPCKAFSQLRHIVAHNHAKEPDKYHPAENLIPEYERVVGEAQPAWFVMENVRHAPEPSVPGYAVCSFVLNNRWVIDATPQNRLRRFSFGVMGSDPVDLRRYLEVALFEPVEFEQAVLASGSGGGRAVPVRLGAGGKPKRLTSAVASRSVSDYARLQGLPEDFLDDAPFTQEGKRLVIGNGVPLPLGRAIAKAVCNYLNQWS